MITCIGFGTALFTIQRSGDWFNSIQFAYLSVYAIGILAGLVLARLAQKKSIVTLFLIIIVVGVTVPNSIFTLRFLTKEKILISDTELQALSFLKNQQKGVVLSFPDSKNSSYVPVFSKHVGYLIGHATARLLNLPIS